MRLVAITYEPQFDTPERLHRFATDRGLRLGEQVLAVALDAARHAELVDELLVPVNYNAGWVNSHGIEAVLLDKRGRPVRRYSTLLWDNDRVTGDLSRALNERD